MIPLKVIELENKINKLKKDLPSTKNKIKDLYLKIEKEREIFIKNHIKMRNYLKQIKNGVKKNENK
tara:strand:+ start:584 stop:781 length:198 start_codon:yes stop_codon:yes gene_type:complete